MSIAPFVSCYLFSEELAQYGLPTVDTAGTPDIMNLVQFASSLIDETCGRLDGDGSGSMAFTTYTQRILLQTRNRNLIYLPLKPIVSVDTGTVAALQLAASGQGASGNFYFTGLTPNTTFRPDGTLSGIVSASGRYGYTRQDMSIAYPDLFAFINHLNLVTMFGGPAPWVAIDVGQIDYDLRTGECWIPAGLQLQRYSEVLISYNSGYDPRTMHRLIKHATASLVKNALGKGNATTALLSMQLGKSGANATFYNDLMDPTLDRLLTPFKMVRAY
jgi:hypothetical protein